MIQTKDSSGLAKPFLFSVKITFDNVPTGKEDEFAEIAMGLSRRCRMIKFLKGETSDVYSILELSFDEYEDFLVTTCIKNEYLKSFKLLIEHYSPNMKPIYEEKFFVCKATYVEECIYDKFDTTADRLVKTIGIKCKRGK